MEEAIGAAKADVARMDALEELQGGEVVVNLPDQVGKEDQDADGDATPEPAAAKMPTRAGEENADEYANGEEGHGVLGHQACADYGSDGKPPAGIFRLEQTNDEVGGQDPPEIVEARVHQNRSVEKRDGRDAGCDGSGDLREATAAEIASHQASQNDHGAKRQSRGEAHADQRWTEEGEGDAREKRSERRVGDVSPDEVTPVVERGEFVAMKAVTAIGKGVQKDAEGSKQQETADFGASDSLAGKRESRKSGSRWHDVRIQGRRMGHGCGFGKGE